MSKMTDKEIIKALENKKYGGHSCVNCKYGITKGEDRCGLKGCYIARNALDLINRQQKQLDNYSHNVRNMAKDFIDQQKIIQEQQAEIEKLNVELVGMKGACNSYKMHYDNAKTEIEKLKKAVEIHKGIAEDWKYEAKKLKEMVGEGE